MKRFFEIGVLILLMSFLLAAGVTVADFTRDDSGGIVIADTFSGVFKGAHASGDVITDSVDATYGIYDTVSIAGEFNVGSGTDIHKIDTKNSHLAIIIGTDTFWAAADTTGF